MVGKALALPLCGARTRAGGACRNGAGKRTPHLGQGKCWKHGGLTPIKHGRYSMVTRVRVKELLEEFEADPNPLSTLPEIALARALLVDYVERYDQWKEAFLAWHASFSAGGLRPISEDMSIALESMIREYEILARECDVEWTDQQNTNRGLAADLVKLLRMPVTDKPREVLDVADAVRLADTVTKMVERVEKAAASNAISRADLYRVMTEMGRVVQAHVPDEAVQQKIKDGWLSIALA